MKKFRSFVFGVIAGFSIAVAVLFSPLQALAMGALLAPSHGGILSPFTLTGISGTLGVGNGGTGQTTFTASQLLYGNGTAALSSVATTTLTVGTSLAYSGATVGALVGGIAGTLSLNMGNSNWWTALQNFTLATTSQLTATSSVYLATGGGNVGIGTTSPFAMLSIGNSTNDINTNLFVIASSTASATTTAFSVNNSGHIIASSTNPVLSGCGTGATMKGSDMWGTVTSGTSNTTGCTITFGQPFSNAPSCTATDENATSSFAYSETATALTIVDVNIGVSKFDFSCRGMLGPQ